MFDPYDIDIIHEVLSRGFLDEDFRQELIKRHGIEQAKKILMGCIWKESTYCAGNSS